MEKNRFRGPKFTDLGSGVVQTDAVARTPLSTLDFHWAAQASCGPQAPHVPQLQKAWRGTTVGLSAHQHSVPASCDKPVLRIAFSAYTFQVVQVGHHCHCTRKLSKHPRISTHWQSSTATTAPLCSVILGRVQLLPGSPMTCSAKSMDSSRLRCSFGHPASSLQRQAFHSAGLGKFQSHFWSLPFSTCNYHGCLKLKLVVIDKCHHMCSTWLHSTTAQGFPQI